MAPSLVEKYEQILAADPRSRIFVELAKALVDQGEHGRAIEVCRNGLEHHPSSVLGRVIWGRALLESGDRDGALEQFETAVAIDPDSPYGFNLAGEALVQRELWREALPFLSRAVELQPGDARLRAWLEKATAGGSTPPASRPAAPTAPATAPAPARSRSAPPVTPAGTPAVPPPAAPNAARNEATPPRPPPIRTMPAPPPIRRDGSGGRSVLSMIPGETGEVPRPKAGRRAPPPVADAAEAARIAAQYERELRDKILGAPEPPPGFLARHRTAAAAAALVVVLGGAVGVYLAVRARSRAELAERAVGAARAGLARDTLASLRKAAEVLAEARDARPDDLQIASLAAQVNAVLAADHGDADARKIAAALSDPAVASDGALAARLLLASGGAARRDAEKAVLSAGGSTSPLLQALAGEVLFARAERKDGRARLEAAARATPPLLRALADLGDAELQSGDPEGALAYYGAAIAAVPTHPRSVVGAAEARLLLGRGLESSRTELAAVDADAGSAPPVAARLRFELAYARVLAASGDRSAATDRLARAGEKLGRTAALDAAAAEIELSARAYDRAESAAARAVDQEPKNEAWRVLLARARNGRGRYQEALAATAAADGRPARIQRAVARYGLGQFPQAKAELEKLARGGKMPAEAAVWYGLCDVASGRAAKARPMLEKLASGPGATALAIVALGRAEEAQGEAAAAEQTYRAAIARDASFPEAHAALGELLLAKGRAKEAIPPLERAVQLDAFALDARRALGEARLAAGHPAAARADLDAVLVARPRDAEALRALSAAYLAEKQPADARRIAERAVAADRSAASHLAVARAALASGDAAEARRAADRALALARRGPDADEARRLAVAASRKG
jgi:predicted Zn-dependent protease